jgi:SAM-dependent methyltransferase
MRPGVRGPGARGAYDAFARAYDAYTADYEYDRWIATVLAIAEDLGLRGREALDAACGTANSTLPLIARGLDVSACDLSPGMVAEARRKLPDRRRVGVADIRSLGLQDRFDLVTCLDDGVNYLLGEDDLRAGLRGLAGSLRPGGVLVFDVNTLGTLRAAYSGVHEYETGDWRFRWTGHSSRTASSGCVAAGTLTIDRRRRDGRHWAWRRTSRALHRQAHHDRQRLDDALCAAGMEVQAVFGQSPGVVLAPELAEDLHTKALVFARRRRRHPCRPHPIAIEGGEAHAHPSVKLPGSASRTSE